MDVETEKHSDSGDSLPCFIILYTGLMCEYLNSVSVCSRCNYPLRTSVDLSSIQGYGCDIIGRCRKCRKTVELFTTSKRTSYSADSARNAHAHKRLFEVNMRLVTFVREIGKGEAALNKLTKVINMPGTLNTSAYQNAMDRLYEASTKVAEDSLKRAALEVFEIDPQTMVSVDGSWQRRGHKSHNGVVTVCSVPTGKVLDYEVLSNYCKVCETDSTQEHVCQKNHEGSSNAMEGVGAIRIFHRSVEKHNLKYVEYLGDGDSSSFTSVKVSKPYGDNIILSKKECCGHVQKRCGSRLRKLKSTYRCKKLCDGKSLTGIGRLTDKIIDKLQLYYGLAIRINKNNITQMVNDVHASLYHVASSEAHPDHSMCPDGYNSWCK